MSLEERIVLQEIARIRKKHPRMGGRKLHFLLSDFMIEHQVKMGRDLFFNLLACNGLLVKRRKRGIRTTYSSHWLRKYPNLIREYEPDQSNKLWVSDITYWKIDKKHVYISFITDVFSHKVMGYQLADNLEAVESIKALKMALLTLSKNELEHLDLIHHSDRGVQYCSKGYVDLLHKYGIKISMTENGDPLENAIAERLNGIIKDEYLYNYTVENITDGQLLLEKVITLYNEERPHSSIGNLTPDFVHQNNIKTERLWKNYYQEKTSDVNPI